MSEISELKDVVLEIEEILGGRRLCTMPKRRVRHPEGGELKTKQSMAESTDINRIMDRWLKHGASVVHLNPQTATYGDFSSGLDYASALNAVKAAEKDFASLPARVRAKCGNDPAEFLQIIFDPEREEDREGLGLGFARKPERDPVGSAGPGGDPAPVKEVVQVKGVEKAVPQGDN